MLGGPGHPSHPCCACSPNDWVSLQGLDLSLGLWHFLDGVLHRVWAIGGSLLLPTQGSLSTLLPLVLPWRVTSLEVSSPWKSNKHFVETLFGPEKNLPSCLCSKHKFGTLCQHCSAGYVGTAVQEVGTWWRKKISEIRLSIDSDLSRKLG